MKTSRFDMDSAFVFKLILILCVVVRIFNYQKEYNVDIEAEDSDSQRQFVTCQDQWSAFNNSTETNTDPSVYDFDLQHVKNVTDLQGYYNYYYYTQNALRCTAWRKVKAQINQVPPSFALFFSGVISLFTISFLLGMAVRTNLKATGELKKLLEQVSGTVDEVRNSTSLCSKLWKSEVDGLHSLVENDLVTKCLRAKKNVGDNENWTTTELRGRGCYCSVDQRNDKDEATVLVISSSSSSKESLQQFDKSDTCDLGVWTESASSPDVEIVGPSQFLGTANKKFGATQRSFDIVSAEGRKEWSIYMREQMSNRGFKDWRGQEELEDQNVLPLQYRDVVTVDQNNKPLKRILVLGRGWVSAKQMCQEIEEYGIDAYVRKEQKRLNTTA